MIRVLPLGAPCANADSSATRAVPLAHTYYKKA